VRCGEDPLDAGKRDVDDRRVEKARNAPKARPRAPYRWASRPESIIGPTRTPPGAANLVPGHVLHLRATPGNPYTAEPNVGALPRANCARSVWASMQQSGRVRPVLSSLGTVAGIRGAVGCATWARETSRRRSASRVHSATTRGARRSARVGAAHFRRGLPPDRIGHRRPDQSDQAAARDLGAGAALVAAVPLALNSSGRSGMWVLVAAMSSASTPFNARSWRSSAAGPAPRRS